MDCGLWIVDKMALPGHRNNRVYIIVYVRLLSDTYLPSSMGIQNSLVNIVWIQHPLVAVGVQYSLGGYVIH